MGSVWTIIFDVVMIACWLLQFGKPALPSNVDRVYLFDRHVGHPLIDLRGQQDEKSLEGLPATATP